MNIDNSISVKKIKKVLTPKIIAIALLVALIVSTVFYITLENNDKNEINIWYISEDNYDSLLSENLRAVEEYIAERGFAAHWKYKKATLSQNDDAFDTWL